MCISPETLLRGFEPTTFRSCLQHTVSVQGDEEHFLDLGGVGRGGERGRLEAEADPRDGIRLHDGLHDASQVTILFLNVFLFVNLSSIFLRYLQYILSFKQHHCTKTYVKPYTFAGPEPTMFCSEGRHDDHYVPPPALFGEMVIQTLQAKTKMKLQCNFINLYLHVVKPVSVLSVNYCRN
jgi:hypothetical protein